MIDVTWFGPLDLTGYGNATRASILALNEYASDRVNLSVRPTNKGWEKLVPQFENGSVFDHLAQRTTKVNDTICVAEALPEWFPIGIYPNVVGYTFFETAGLPKRKVMMCNRATRIWAPSNFNKETFSRAGVAIPIDVVTPPVARPKEGIEHWKPNGAKSFNFVSVFDMNWRKGWDALLLSYAMAFSDDDDVSLTIKVFGGDPAGVKRAVGTLLRNNPNPPTVVLITSDIADEKIEQLVAGADAFVLPTRGEGWGMPLAQAMSYGVPTIATGWGGHTHFMSKENSYLIDYELRTVTESNKEMSSRGYKGETLAEPNIDSLQEVMKKVASSPEEAKAKAAKAAEDMKEYSPEKVADRIVTALEEV